MRINLLMEVVNLDGTPIPEVSGGNMTLKSIFCSALTSQKQGETITGIEKVKRYNLATHIYAAGEVDLGIDDIKLLRDLVADGYIPLVVGQVWNILDPPPEAKEASEPPPVDRLEKGKI